ncbi:hypothetical protein D2U88_17580 [Flagellimonas aequoris]|uniref:Uncharacterized protein n=2 Tax=Flavobacteriaceae TaxID=49546 RepID=A0A223VAE9_9FLAO|nr:hypothetical protein CJ263_20210 [Maribacter cobaltidurans]RIV68973.1 hypothetical protein D2U88_17580 [Allomuricauda aequoris]
MILHATGNLDVGNFLADGDQGKKDGDTDDGLTQLIGKIGLLVAYIEIGKPCYGNGDTGNDLDNVDDFTG